MSTSKGFGKPLKSAVAAVSIVAATTLSSPTQAAQIKLPQVIQNVIQQAQDAFKKAEAPKVAKSKSKMAEGPVWLENAKKHLGLKEYKGKGKSNKLIEMMHDLTTNAEGRSDAAAWCSSFVNWILETTADEFNLSKNFRGTKSSGARHFWKSEAYIKKTHKKRKGWGTAVSVNDLHNGDIATIIWNGGTKGHVAFVVGLHQNSKGEIDGVWLLGGNQAVSEAQGKTEGVTVSLYKLSEAKLFGFKRPTGYVPNKQHRSQVLTKDKAYKIYGEHVGKRGSLATSQ